MTVRQLVVVAHDSEALLKEVAGHLMGSLRCNRCGDPYDQWKTDLVPLLLIEEGSC